MASKKSNAFIAGTYINQFKGKKHEYKSFSPNTINKHVIFNNTQIPLLVEKARGALGELNAYSRLVPDVNFFIQMHVIKEATTSSRIEGTKTAFDEAILPQEEINPEKRDDWKEVQNYIGALNYAIARLDKIPLSMRLIKETHKKLLAGVRGKHKQPGEVRTSQNHIGGSNLSNAFFVPPHNTEVPMLLSDLEHFWHNKALHMQELVKIAISHYQFETIHPFLDGNGRTGRLLITLQLIDYGILDKPTLYLSEFFEQHRGEYFDALTVVRSSGDIEQWILFFLDGLIQTAEKGKKTFTDIIDLRNQYNKEILQFGKRAERAEELITAMFAHPIINITQASKVLDVSFNTANTLIQSLVKIGILKENTEFSRNKLFVLDSYVKLFMK